MIDLYEATFDSEHLRWADKLQQSQIKLFWDETSGGFFKAPATSELILRMKDDQDSAEPSANSVSARNLLRLGTLVGDRSYDEKAIRTCQSLGSALENAPWAFPAILLSVVGCLEGMRQIVLVGMDNDEITEMFLKNLRERVLVNTVVIRLDPQEPDEWLVTYNDMLQEVLKISSEGKPFVSICEGYSCGLPIREVEGLIKALD